MQSLEESLFALRKQSYDRMASDVRQCEVDGSNSVSATVHVIKFYANLNSDNS